MRAHSLRSVRGNVRASVLLLTRRPLIHHVRYLAVLGDEGVLLFQGHAGQCSLVVPLLRDHLCRPYLVGLENGHLVPGVGRPSVAGRVLDLRVRDVLRQTHPTYILQLVLGGVGAGVVPDPLLAHFLLHLLRLLHSSLRRYWVLHFLLHHALDL